MVILNVPIDTDMGLTAKLLRIRETQQHEKIQGIPIDIYAKSMTRVERALKELIKHTNNIPEKSDSLNHPVKTYIQALTSFYDNIFRILKYSQDLGSKADNNNSIAWLRDNGSIANKKFFKNTRTQQILISKIDNKLKHEIAEIVEFELVRTYIDKVTKIKSTENIEGFYINAAIGEKDLWGPDPDVHTYLDDITATAISYNFFIVNTCHSLIHWLRVLSSILNNSDENLAESVNSSLTNILMIVSDIKEEFFIDEYKKAYVKISFVGEKYHIVYPYKFKQKIKNRKFLEDNLSAIIDVNPRTGLANQKIPYINIASKHLSII